MKILPFILILFSIHLNSQVKTYEFSFCGREQKVKLYERDKQRFAGIIESKFHRKNGRIITKKNKIDRNIVHKIITELDQKEIFELKDKGDKIDCGDFYLDGDYFSVSITNEKEKTKIQKEFDEIYPESESKIIEKNDCRRNAQLVATIIDEKLHLKEIYSQHFKKLGVGTCYWTGISKICKTKKKK